MGLPIYMDSQRLQEITGFSKINGIYKNKYSLCLECDYNTFT